MSNLSSSSNLEKNGYQFIDSDRNEVIYSDLLIAAVVLVKNFMNLILKFYFNQAKSEEILSIL